MFRLNLKRDEMQNIAREEILMFQRETRENVFFTLFMASDFYSPSLLFPLDLLVFGSGSCSRKSIFQSR